MKRTVDIILLSYESPDLLKKCVQSVLEHTRIDSRLIIVDNASKEPEVKNFLNKLSGNDRVSLEKIFSEENAGFAGGMNKALKLSDAPFVCLLNNDCVVTDGWLEEMIDIARTDNKIGLVNPQSNTFGSWPAKDALLESHALLIKQNKGKFVELGSVIAFACLIKREVVEKIGYLDEAYRGVCYEDTDFSERAKKAGFVPVMAEGAYVFHLEQASRRNLKDKKIIYQKNRELFESRWGKLLRIFVFPGPRESQRSKNELYDDLKGLARKRSIIELWFEKNNKDNGKKDFFCDNGEIRHADIGIRMISRNFAAMKLSWRIFTKKKRYDAIILPKGFFMRFPIFLGKLYGSVPFILDGHDVRTADGAIFNLKEPSLLVEYLHKKRG